MIKNYISNMFKKNDRPLSFTILCSFYFVYWAISLLSLVAALLIRIGSEFPAKEEISKQVVSIFLGLPVEVNALAWLIVVGLIVGVVGFWLYQKWAVIVYGASTVALFILALPPVASAPSKTFYAYFLLYLLASYFAINIALITFGVIKFKKMQ